MPNFTTADRLNQIMSERNLKQVDIIRMAQPYCISFKVKLGRNDLSQYLSGKVEPRQNKLYILAKALNVNEAWLMGYDVPRERKEDGEPADNLPAPEITDDFIEFPVIGEVAAGFEHIAIEDWSGDKIKVPREYLSGHNREDFFVLKVKGDSMYPQYQDGDKVLVLRQSTMNYSGQIGVVIYDGDKGTLKKIEYAQGEDWMKLVPVNPNHPTIKIENEDLERCRVLGIPRLLVREIVD